MTNTGSWSALTDFPGAAFILDENHTDDANRYPMLALHAVRVDEHGWCGWHVPIVTAGEFRRYVAAWARIDPNGTWSPDGVVEGDGALVYDDGEHDKDVWEVCGMHGGAPLYGLSGWCWVQL